MTILECIEDIKILEDQIALYSEWKTRAKHDFSKFRYYEGLESSAWFQLLDRRFFLITLDKKAKKG